MPIKDPARRAAVHKSYMKDVWYPKNKQKHIAMVARVNAKRKERFAEVLATLKPMCLRCGESHISVLDFHHLDPSQKKFQININACWRSIASILAEISKCEVLCSNCHRKLHWEERHIAD